jgi:hypothetical protein
MKNFSGMQQTCWEEKHKQTYQEKMEILVILCLNNPAKHSDDPSSTQIKNI